MKKIITLLFILVLVSCNKESNESDISKVANKPKVETASNGTPRPPTTENEPVANDSIDEHHDHDHNHDSEVGGIEENIDGLAYVTLETPYPTDNTDKVVVYEFFGYTCGHCYNFEPQMTKWSENKPDYVEIIRVPLNFQQGWGVLQQGYLTASSMGIADDNHAKLFAAIHQERKTFRTIEDLAAWYADHSKVSKEEFLSTAQSFIIDSQQRKADKMGFTMKITGTPTLVINGKHKPTNKLKSREDVLKVMSLLVEKEAKEMGLINP
jgi:thiol:disulfide interchange protein DsbA